MYCELSLSLSTCSLHSRSIASTDLTHDVHPSFRHRRPSSASGQRRSHDRVAKGRPGRRRQRGFRPVPRTPFPGAGNHATTGPPATSGGVEITARLSVPVERRHERTRRLQGVRSPPQRPPQYPPQYPPPRYACAVSHAQRRGRLPPTDGYGLPVEPRRPVPGQ